MQTTNHQTLWAVDVVQLDTGLVLLRRSCTGAKLGRIVAGDHFGRDSRISVVATRRAGAWQAVRDAGKHRCGGEVMARQTTRPTTERQNEARRILEWCGIPLGAGFYTLSSEQVDALLVQADNWRYRKPANANGSRARYFHAFMQRMAAKETK